MSALSELFARDPLALTKTDLDEIVAFYRAHRGQFALVKKDGAVKKVRVKKAATPKKTKKTKPVDLAQIDIEELIAASKVVEP